jgi:predicted kinase
VDVVVIAGSPGSGKSTLMSALAEKLGDPPKIEFSDLREWHLDPLWQRQSPAEESIAFENVVFVIDNYRRHGMTPVLVTDFREHRVADLARRFEPSVVVISLVATDAVIRERIGARTDGFTSVEAASEWNARVAAADVLDCEQRHDTTTRSVNEIATFVASSLRCPSASQIPHPPRSGLHLSPNAG